MADPGNQSLLAERGGVYVRRREWKKAAADFDKVAELSATRGGAIRQAAGAGAAAFYNSVRLSAIDESGWLRALALWAASGDGDTYRRRCEEILTHFADLADGDQAQWILRGCLAMPPSNKAQALVQPLAKRSYRSPHKFGLYVPLAKGLADLRAGRYAEAIERSQDVLDAVEMQMTKLPEANRQLWRGLAAQCYFVRVICYHQLGQPAEAQRAFDQGIAYRESAICPSGQPAPKVASSRAQKSRML